MKELIEKLRKIAYDYPGVGKIPLPVLQWYIQAAVCGNEAADAIERLQLELTAASLRIENDKIEFARIYKALHSHAEITQKAEAERDALRAELDTKQSAYMDGFEAAKHEARDAYEELLAELGKLRQQEPVALLRSSYCTASTGESLYTETQVRQMILAGAKP